MHTKFKRILAIALTLIMLLGAMGAVTASADDGFSAKLGFANADWSAQEWGDNAFTTVNGAGSYSVSWNGAASDALVFVVDLVGANEAVTAAGLSLTALEVLVDGNPIAVDLSKIVTGDLEENGNYRIEIYNEYGATKENPGIDPAAVNFASNLTVNFTLGVAGSAAKLGFANADWSAQEWGDNAFTTVNGAGSYSVSWNGAASDALVFVVDVVGANADITAAGLGLTALEVLVDGNPIAVDPSKIVTGDLEENGNYRIEIYNEYGATKENPGIDPAAVNFASNLTVNFTLGAASTASYTTNLGFASTDWAAQEWGENANTTVTGAGSYSISWNGASTDAGVFVIDLVGAGTDLAANNQTYTVTALEILLDGNPIAVDLSKIVTGDLEENGNYRIEIYNQYGTSAADPGIDPAAVVFAENLTINFTLALTESAPVVDEPVEEPTPVAEFDPAGTYNGYLLLQTPNWTYRDAWNSANGIGSDYWGNYVYGNETSQTYGVVTDAVIAGNGTYSITITDFGTIFEDDFLAAGQDYFNILGISTDIPLNDSVAITDVKVIVDGKTRHTDAEAFLDPDDAEYVKVLIVNIWNPDKSEISYYPAPTESLEIQFTIAGFNYDKPVEEVPEEPSASEPAEPSTPPAVEEPSGNNTGLIIGIVVAVVVIIAVVVVVVTKKKGTKTEA